MPPMKPKKLLKSMTKDVEQQMSTKMKKPKKRNYQSFSIYLFKLLRTITKENFGISRHSMLIMNDFVNDMLEKIAAEAGRLTAQGKKNTLSSWEIQTAVRLLIPGELSKHANIEAMKAVSLYHKSRERDAPKE